MILNEGVCIQGDVQEVGLLSDKKVYVWWTWLRNSSVRIGLVRSQNMSGTEQRKDLTNVNFHIDASIPWDINIG